ncbi:2-amino-4-hydroxy-6-hydroxymethyldihydropteridine diphosphokinase [Candidatus Bipolaricaulota bacterium]
MTLQTVFLSFGANLGNPREQIEQGIMTLNDQCVRVIARSSWYETEPVGMDDQPWFLNLVAHATTSLDPYDLLAECQQAERQAGRMESVRFGPRHLDIDILLYGDRIIDSQELTIPHPRMGERRFVLVPLLEIAPDLEDPVFHQSYAETLSRLDEGKKVLRSLINES